MNPPDHTISRRAFARLLGAGAALAVTGPKFSLAREATPAAASGVVRLSSNENPYGPSPRALEAMREAFAIANRYPFADEEKLADALAKLYAVERAQVLLGDGSGEILKLAAVAFTGPNDRPLVAADPTFEAILKHAAVSGAEVVKIPLTSGYAHDLEKMSSAAKSGLVYLCNPNNPTASITPKAAVRQFLAKLPATTTVLVDEAYAHYAESPEFESVVPLIADHPNLIVTRTFSKIYGMAGLRCGFALGQKEMIGKMARHQPSNSVNCMALAAAVASLADGAQVTEGKRRNTEVRRFVSAELAGLGYELIPSEANFIMFDLKRPVVPVIAALKERKVQVGRLFPTLPNHLRLTIGTRPEMEAFLAAFRVVMA